MGTWWYSFNCLTVLQKCIVFFSQLQIHVKLQQKAARMRSKTIEGREKVCTHRWSSGAMSRNKTRESCKYQYSSAPFSSWNIDLDSQNEMVYKLRYSYPERIFRKDFLFNIMITSCKFEADFLVIINVAAISLQSERQLLETKGKNSCKRVKVRSRQCRMAFPRVRSQPNLLEFIAVPFSPLIIE